MHIRTYLVTVFLIGALVGAPLLVRAQTADQLRAQIAQILAQIYALRAQLQTDAAQPTLPRTTTPVIPQSNSASLSPTTPPANGLATFQYSRCPNLQFNLERGDRDAAVAEEVTMLQRFLRQDPRLYPEGLVTGYFGPATERAVQRFQMRHGIVDRGDYRSTGYGRVGPRTRHAIKNSCGAAGSYSFAVSPIAGAVPLQVSATFSFRGSSCTSYLLDWGDGSAPLAQQAPQSANCSNDTVRKQVTHTYTTAGAYVVTLRVGNGSVYTLPIVGRANVIAQGAPGAGSGSRATLILSRTQGDVPLTVTATLRSETPARCTSYELNWGDGTPPTLYEAGNAPCVGAPFSQTFTHTYRTAGTYSVRARAGRGSIATLTPIDKRIAAGTGSGTSAANNCFVEPSSGAAPLAARARILLGGSLCDGSLTYRIDWGDGETSPTQVCADQNTHYEQLTHTYQNPGTYTAYLYQSHPNARFEAQSCTVQVTRAQTRSPRGGIAASCQSWTDGCNTCTRTYAGGPAACTQRYCVQYGAQQCYRYFPSATTYSAPSITSDSLSYRVIDAGGRTVQFTAHINAARDCLGGIYEIDFGDSQRSQQPYPADACRTFTRTVTHTYAQDGVYTASLTKGGVLIDRVTVTVSGSSSTAETNLAAVISAIERLVRVIFK